MAYDKSKPMAAGKAAIAVVYALKDGLQLAEDSDELIAFLMAMTGAVDEFKADTVASIAHLIAGAADEWGDRRVDIVPPA